MKTCRALVGLFASILMLSAFPALAQDARVEAAKKEAFPARDRGATDPRVQRFEARGAVSRS